MRFLGASSLALAVLMIGLSSIQTELSRQSLYSLSTAFWSEFRRLLAEYPRSSRERFSGGCPGLQGTGSWTLCRELCSFFRSTGFQEAYRLALGRSQVRSLELYPLLCQAGEIPGTVSIWSISWNSWMPFSPGCGRSPLPTSGASISSLRLWHSLSVFGALFVFIFLI